MEKAVCIDEAIMNKHSKSIWKILKSPKETSKNHEWAYDDDGEEKGHLRKR